MPSALPFRDHVLAWVDGGKTTYDNGQTLCGICNTGKHAAKEVLLGLRVVK